MDQDINKNDELQFSSFTCHLKKQTTSKNVYKYCRDFSVSNLDPVNVSDVRPPNPQPPLKLLVGSFTHD